ncbi:MAG: ankyrin repeat domain-containing protein [Planctomycetota bacterium]|jgi:outer membrane protein assembly factor BamD (BamD/ComL family)
MDSKRAISLTACLILVTVFGASSLILADIVSESDTQAERHYEKATELSKVADHDAAIAEYEKAISLSPKSKIAQDAQYWIGQSHFRAGRFDTALAAFKKLLDDYPTSEIAPSTKQMIKHVQQAKKNRSLFEAVVNGDIKQVRSLLSKGADVNARDEDDWAPLHYAAHYGQKEAAKVLISKAADVNAKNESGKTPLHVAADFGIARRSGG